MRQIIAMAVLVVIAGFVLIGLTAADSADTIATYQVPAVESGHLTTQEIIQ